MEIARIQSSQIMTFLELKRNIEMDNDKDQIKKLVREMIDLGIKLETAQAHDGVRVLMNPIDKFV